MSAQQTVNVARTEKSQDNGRNHIEQNPLLR
jgi:hypothetical protein